MRIAVLGASGRTGRRLVDAAVGAGHDVVALTRDSTSLPGGPAVQVVHGDARDPIALRELVAGATAVVSALGPRGRDHGLQTAVARGLVDAMSDAGVRRFVGVSVAGLDLPEDRRGARDRILSRVVRTLARDATQDRRGELEAWRGSGLDWTLVRVPRLVDGDAEPAIVLDPHVPPRATTLHRGTLATALLHLATGDELVGQALFAADARRGTSAG